MEAKKHSIPPPHLLDEKVCLVANQGRGQKRFCQELTLGAVLATQIVQEYQAFVVYGD
ncbi:MAG: hypothetical protein ACOYT7_00590 [Patescibacteria group bacterium]